MRVASVLLALIVWQAGARALSQSLLLVAPTDVISELFKQIPEPAFWGAVWFSLARIMLGFLSALAIGALLASLSYRVKAFGILIWPYVTVIKSTPIASIIILCLIWIGSVNLSVFVAFMIVLPVVYANLLEGLRSADINLLEMARVMRMGPLRRVKYIYLPQIRPHLLSACGASIGMAWKAGVAAEVIGIPAGSIGERLYEAKVYLSTRELFAWTVVVIILSVAMEKLFIKALALAYARLERP